MTEKITFSSDPIGHSFTGFSPMETSPKHKKLGLAQVSSSLISQQNGSVDDSYPFHDVESFFNWLHHLIFGCFIKRTPDERHVTLISEARGIFDSHAKSIADKSNNVFRYLGINFRNPPDVKNPEVKAAIIVKLDGRLILLEKKSIRKKSLPDFQNECLQKLEKILQTKSGNGTLGKGVLFIQTCVIKKDDNDHYNYDYALTATDGKEKSSGHSAGSASIITKVKNHCKGDTKLEKDLLDFFFN